MNCPAVPIKMPPVIPRANKTDACEMSRSICKPVLFLIAVVMFPRRQARYGPSHTGRFPLSPERGSRVSRGTSDRRRLARLFDPTDVAIHPNGDLYIADTYNNSIRKVDKSGTITTVAGTGSSTSATAMPTTTSRPSSAELNHPSGIAFDAAGNLYIADTDHDRIRRVDGVTGIITTVAGTGERGYNGDNQPATLAKINSPYHIALDALGNLFIADDGNHRVRRVDANTGIITTVAGTGNAGYNGDDQPATQRGIAESARGLDRRRRQSIYRGLWQPPRARRGPRGRDSCVCRQWSEWIQRRWGLRRPPPVSKAPSAWGGMPPEIFMSPIPRTSAFAR